MARFTMFFCIAILAALACAGAADIPVVDQPDPSRRSQDAIEPVFDTADVDRVVILCSAADSMSADIVELKATLHGVIQSFKPAQHFSLLLFHDDQLDGQGGNNELLTATPENKALAFKLIDAMKPAGSNMGLPAVEAAFKCQPQRIILISSAGLKDNREVLKRIAELNKDHKVEVTSVGWSCDTVEAVESLQQIAKAGGGLFSNEPTRPQISGPPNHGIGPNGPVFGNGNARSIIFICNINTTTGNLGSTLKDQLNKTVIRLWPAQRFGVIFAGADKPQMFHPDTPLSAADSETQRRLGTFLDEGLIITPKTDPIPAIERALNAKPQLIYLLTDSDFPDDALLLKKARELNRVHFRVNTIAMRSDDQKEFPASDVLKTLAKETGGTYRVVNADDL